MKPHFNMWAAGATGLALCSSFLIAPGGAQAQSACLTGQTWSQLVALGSTGCSIGDKIFKNFSTGSFTAGSFDITAQPSGYSLQGSSLSLGTGTYNYSYDVVVTNPGNVFDKYRTTISTASLLTTDGTGSLTATGEGTSTSVVSNNNSTAGNVVTFNANATSTTFTGQIIVTNGVMDTYTNRLSQRAVPGPLPILGAGAMFGFSRRLRSRISKAA